MKYRYKIVGLTCPNCALKIENKLNQHPDFSNVVINFSSLKISYETNITNSLKKINELIKEIEPNVTIIEDGDNKKEYHLSVLIIGILLGIIGLLGTGIIFKIFLYLAYIILLAKPFSKALNLLFKSHTINENLLITISCLGALLIQNEMEGIMVVSLYLIGKILEEKAINKTRNSVSSLLSLKIFK